MNKNLDLFKVMKLIICLLIIGVHVSAAVYSQNISLNEKNASLESVIKKIEQQSGYSFVYKIDLLRQNATKINVSLKSGTLDQALQESLKGQPLSYVIVYKTVIIKSKTELPTQSAVVISKTLRGKVVDEANQPIPGVSVKIDGTNIATTTDANGSYKLDLTPGNYKIVFSSIGYETKIFAKTISSTDENLTLNITLTSKITNLQESIVVGYTVKKANEITGALQTFNTKQLEGVTSNDVIAELKGKVLGTYITEPSGNPNSKSSFVVRGQGTIPITGDLRVTNNLNPLIVVDGIIYSDVTNPSDIVATPDIETITFLRDAASTSIYGSRASQGVIVITTKKGVAGNTRVEANATYGVSQRNLGKIKFMNSQQLYDYQKQILLNSFAINNEGLSQADYLAQYLPNASVLSNNTNWNSLIYRNGLTKALNASISGGDDNTRYYFGVNNYNEDGALKGNSLTRTGVKLNVEHNVSSKLIIGGNISLIFDRGNESPSLGGGEVSNLPWYTPYNADGTFKKVLGQDVLGNFTTNPLYDLSYNSNETKTQQLIGVFTAKYNFTNWLTFASNNAYNTSFSDNEVYNDRLSLAGFGNNGTLTQRKTDGNSFLSSNLLTLNKHIGKHNISGLAGYEYNHSVNEYNGLAVQNIPSGIKIPSAAAAPFATFNGKAIVGEKFTRGFFSDFFQGGYNYDERYYFNASFRSDYSDNFGINNRYGNFYSVSGAWLLSRESFLANNSVITNLKLRTSYGTTGKVAGEDFLTESYYNFSSQYAGDPAAVIFQLGNKNITWERANNINVGIDLGLFNRITINADIYRKRTSGLIQKVQISALQGVPNQYQNIGQILNHGVELQLSSKNIVGKFNWQTQFNISFNTNKVEKLVGEVSGYNGVIKVGSDIAAVNTVKWLGVDKQTGQPQFQRVVFDNNGKVTGYQTVNSYDAVFDGLSGAAFRGQFQNVGNTTPKFFGGMLNTFSYKNIELSILLNFAQGYLVYNNSRGNFFATEGNNALQYNQILPAAGQIIWQKPGDNATDPQVIRNRTDGADQPTSRFWEDASHIRIRNVRLSYSLPQKLTQKLLIKSARIFLSGDNLYVFTKKTFYGVDPEGGLAGNDSGSTGGIGVGYGASRKYLMGLQLSFN